MTPANSVLRLPPAMHRALNSYVPGYIPWRWDDYTLNVQRHVQTADPPWGELRRVNDFETTRFSNLL